MKIVKLTAENVKRLVAIEIEPGDVPLVRITGKNEQGKTSVLDAIWWALAGVENIQRVPIRKGAKEALIKLDLGDVIVRRTFSDKGDRQPSTLTVESREGARFPSPQGMLNSFLAALSLDPLEFMRAGPKGQFDMLRGFVPGVDFEEIARQQKGDYDRRTDYNRIAKREKAAAELIVVPADTPDQPVDESAVLDEIAQAHLHNATISSHGERRRQMEQSVERCTNSIAQLTQDAESAKREAEDAEIRMLDRHNREREDMQARHTQEKSAAAAELKMRMQRFSDGIAADQAARERAEQALAAAEAVPATIDVEPMQARLRGAKAVNAAVAAKLQRQKHLDAAKAAESESGLLTAKMEGREQGKAAAIAAAKLPVEGLDLGSGEVLLNGLPLSQASDAEQLRVSCALAMAGNPKLKVIRVRDGSLLDSRSRGIVEEIARERGFQVWIEEVNEAGNIGFVLEEGRIVSRPTAGALL